MADLSELFDAFAAGVYLLFGLVHADLWQRRRERLGHLWLAGACGGALMVDLTGMALRRVPPSPPSLLSALNLLGVGLATLCLVELAVSLGSRRAGRAIRALQAGMVVLSPAAGATLEPFLLVPSLLGCGVLVVFAMARAFAAARDGRRGASTVARGFVFLSLCLLADLAMQLGWLPLRGGLPAIGFIVLFLASAKALADRQDHEHRELVALRGELERRVEERTLALQEANARLAVASRTDALTGLPNRRGFVEASEAELERFRRSGRPFTIVLADVDHFKAVNDRFGHATGDEALRAVASAIRANLRAQDVVARWGGEEFILLLPETAEAGGVRAAEFVREQVAASRIALADESLQMTLSLGVSEHRAERTLDATLAAADRALYRAKESGRNRVLAG